MGRNLLDILASAEENFSPSEEQLTELPVLELTAIKQAAKTLENIIDIQTFYETTLANDRRMKIIQGYEEDLNLAKGELDISLRETNPTIARLKEIIHNKWIKEQQALKKFQALSGIFTTELKGIMRIVD